MPSQNAKLPRGFKPCSRKIYAIPNGKVLGFLMGIPVIAQKNVKKVNKEDNRSSDWVYEAVGFCDPDDLKERFPLQPVKTIKKKTDSEKPKKRDSDKKSRK